MMTEEERARRKAIRDHKRKYTPIGTALIDEMHRTGKILNQCPHCGMVDYQFMNQGIGQSHFLIWNVGAVSKRQCGKCRGEFFTLSIQVPVGIEPEELFDRIEAQFTYGPSRETLWELTGRAYPLEKESAWEGDKQS